MRWVAGRPPAGRRGVYEVADEVAVRCGGGESGVAASAESSPLLAYEGGLWVSPRLREAGVTATFTTRQFTAVRPRWALREDAGASGRSMLDVLDAVVPTADVELSTGIVWQDLRAALGFPARVVAARQVHGARVLRITRLGSLGEAGDARAHVRDFNEEQVDRAIDRTSRARFDAGVTAVPTLAEADGIVTDLADCALSVVVADCVPIVLADPFRRVVGVVHAGWRGLAAGVVEAGVAALRSLGADVAGSIALIGPAICPGCYEVGEDVRERVGSRVVEARAHTREGRLALDVRGGVAAVLRAEGIGAIAAVSGCTYEEPGRYYSHRFSVATSAPSGRQAAVVSLIGS